MSIGLATVVTNESRSGNIEADTVDLRAGGSDIGAGDNAVAAVRRGLSLGTYDDGDGCVGGGGGGGGDRSISIDSAGFGPLCGGGTDSGSGDNAANSAFLRERNSFVAVVDCSCADDVAAADDGSGSGSGGGSDSGCGGGGGKSSRGRDGCGCRCRCCS